ncbi:efflux transporter permease [Alcanivorax hongdengensis A-11-3]|uniref:Efflux transporter permease n=1 Tax=Alcanivorax hongdengensis A-11-3 TaxID=1177179 RepID=L0WGY2_9GAMM|nr:FUSC family protein [Alcanivorax hongdengensis]EKF75095.1 efflux transporter permease [Alcanivorax hongdengensis A-11-3]
MMTALDPRLAVFLTPPRSSVLFALKGIIAMTLALYLAMLMQLERPYWALISAVFLQVRPETGLVLEKGLCQIVGTLIGGAVGIVILANLMPYPGLAIAALALWLAFNAGASAWVRQANFIYGFAMAGVTATLIVVLSLAIGDSLTSAQVFSLASARISELGLGAVCATLVSHLLWPAHVGDLLIGHSRDALNQTLAYLELELDPAGSHHQRHARADTLLQSVFALNDDSSAVSYEGQLGQGQARAASVVCQKILALVARIRVFARLKRNHQDLMTPALEQLHEQMRDGFRQLREAGSGEEGVQLGQRLRQQLRQAEDAQSDDAPPLQKRFFQVSQNLIADLIVALEANRALARHDQTLLRANRLQPYRDPLLALAVALRSALVFLVAAGLWIGTASSSAILLMVMPVIFTILFARLPAPELVLQKAVIGALIALPTGLFFTLPLLAASSGDFPLLVMLMGAPLFLGLLAISDRATMAYGLGFCTPFIILVRPGNNMAFAMDQTLSSGLAVTLGIILAYLMFRLITPPSAGLMRRRLLASIADDLARLANPAYHHSEQWFNGRMADRLRRLAECDKVLPQEQRHYTDLGLTALNLGQVSRWLQGRLESYADAALVQAGQHWQQSLARAFRACARGETDPDFARACATLLDQLAYSQPDAVHRRDLIDGALERLVFTFQRLAGRIAGTDAAINNG